MILRLLVLFTGVFVSSTWAAENVEELSRQLTTMWKVNGGRVETLPMTPKQLEQLLQAKETSTESSTGEDLTDSVIGTDDRDQVKDTTAYPYRTIGRLERGCTGTLIGPRHVLTAAHCVYDVRTDTWKDRLDFSAGRNGTAYPYGTVEWDRSLAMKGWTDDHDTHFDLAVVVLKENVGDRLGYQGIAIRGSFANMRLTVAGYPGDKPRGTLWRAQCAFGRLLPQNMYYECDTHNGQSGSALLSKAPNSEDFLIYGVHTNGGRTQNRGVRFTAALLAQLREWKRNF